MVRITWQSCVGPHKRSVRVVLDDAACTCAATAACRCAALLRLGPPPLEQHSVLVLLERPVLRQLPCAEFGRPLTADELAGGLTVLDVAHSVDVGQSTATAYAEAWKQETERWLLGARTAFACANHPRVGAGSCAGVLNVDLVGYICQLAAHGATEQLHSCCWCNAEALPGFCSISVALPQRRALPLRLQLPWCLAVTASEMLMGLAMVTALRSTARRQRIVLRLERGGSRTVVGSGGAHLQLQEGDVIHVSILPRFMGAF
eukprot:TRINITY_DN1342_c0_g3_i1.p1 TRINITY_DN1342_c0_g3~~TRINITY_DN1342_c0_g3_i1.p1  ORF type:complete len:261 (+),score=51.49 TRINITY_DN1342_c0_g3_i1:92-874(+)